MPGLTSLIQSCLPGTQVVIGKIPWILLQVPALFLPSGGAFSVVPHDVVCHQRHQGTFNLLLRVKPRAASL